MEDLTLSKSKSFYKNINEDALKILKSQSTIDAKYSYGRTCLERVRESIVKAKQILEKNDTHLI